MDELYHDVQQLSLFDLSSESSPPEKTESAVKPKRVLTDEHRRKLSEANKGKTFSEERKRKIAEAGKGRVQSEETKAKLSAMQKGKPLSPERREKARVAAKGHVAWNKGKSPSEETKAKLRAANLGKKQSEETRAKRAAALRGRTRPDMRGRPAPNKGVPMREETKAKLSAIFKERPAPRTGIKWSDEERAKLSEAHKGQHLSEEHKAKISKAHKERESFHAQTEETKNKIAAIKKEQWEQRSEEEKEQHIRKLIADGSKVRRNEMSSIEAFVAFRLDVQGIVYERQKRIGRYYVDFYVPSQNLVIEVQGCFWHACEQCGHTKHIIKRKSDAIRKETLQSKGYTVQVLWEHDLRKEMKQYNPEEPTI
jgi:very-short-patch-repair endonuclease